MIAERREASRQLERKMGLNGSSVAHLARQPRQKTELISASLDSDSFAYKEEGLEKLMDDLIDSAIKIGGNRFKSELFPSKKWFQIKGISAITDKK